MADGEAAPTITLTEPLASRLSHLDLVLTSPRPSLVLPQGSRPNLSSCTVNGWNRHALQGELWNNLANARTLELARVHFPSSPDLRPTLPELRILIMSTSITNVTLMALTRLSMPKLEQLQLEDLYDNWEPLATNLPPVRFERPRTLFAVGAGSICRWIFLHATLPALEVLELRYCHWDKADDPIVNHLCTLVRLPSPTFSI